MDWIIGSGLRFGRLVVALAIGLTVIGIAQLRSAPIDVYPEFMPPSVEIQTEALGLSAAEVEQLITLGLEQDLLNGVPWLDRIHSSTPGTGGFFESANQRLSVQHISPISTPQQLSAVPVQDSGKLRLGDVANVIEDHQPLIGDAVSNGHPSLFLVIEKFPGADTLKVTRDVEAAMADMAPGLKGIAIDTQGYRPASFIEAALRHAGCAALIALMRLIALLVAMFGSWRPALIVAVVLPASLTTAA